MGTVSSSGTTFPGRMTGVPALLLTNVSVGQVNKIGALILFTPVPESVCVSLFEPTHDRHHRHTDSEMGFNDTAFY